MTVRFGKQRNRNITKRADERERGRRQRLRRKAEIHLLGELDAVMPDSSRATSSNGWWGNTHTKGEPRTCEHGVSATFV